MDISAYQHGCLEADAPAVDAWVNRGSPENWRQGECYYVCARDGSRHWILLGPMRRHADALARVGDVKTLAHHSDPWSHFYAFGTCRLRTGEHVGSANRALGFDVQAEGARL